VSLNDLWFGLIAVLFTGFFVLEGFDYGVGILLPFLGKTDQERRVLLGTIGPFWDANEVWLITAGGAMFAAFPHWYATMFSGFYLALLLMLLALIVRAVAFEFRSKDRHPVWRTTWDWAIFIGSVVPAFLWGVALANLIRGVPIDASMDYVGGFLNLLNPFALLAGVTSLVGFAFHGAVFLGLRTLGELLTRAQAAARRLWLPCVLVAAAAIAAALASGVLNKADGRTGMTPIFAVGAGLALLAAGWLLRSKKDGWAFGMTALAIAFFVATLFFGLYPRVMVSSLNPDWSLTVTSAASSAYTLRIMSIVALIFVPIVLLYQGWSYWVFRKRVSPTDTLEY
jgi:cytochrome d ubiquinol oxidase subunit II